MFTVMNQFMSLHIANKRIVTAVTVAMIAMLVVTVLLMSAGVVFAGPATAGTGHCSC
jgi:hypothetical protein